MLQEAHLMGIGAQKNQSTPTGAAVAEICRNALATPRVSTQRLADVSAPNDSAHQGEWERHSGWRPVRAERRRVRCAAIVLAVRIEDAHMPARFHDTSHTASCHRAQSAADVD